MITYTSCFGKYDKDYHSADIRYDEIFDPYSGSSAHLSDRLKAKKYKILNPDSLDMWIDSSIEITNRTGLENLFDGDFCVLKHPFHNNLREELDACILKGFVNSQQGNAIEALYDSADLKLEETPVYACTMLYRNSEVAKMNELWWKLICLYSFRDQLTFPFVINQFKNIHLRVIDLELYKNNLFVVNAHN